MSHWGAMIVMGGLCAAAALVAALLVSDKRTSGQRIVLRRPTPAAPDQSEPRR